MNVGSIAKAAAGSSSSGWILAQYNRDISVDFAIIQMGANLIDQYDLDGYPTTIYFDDGSASSTYGSYQTKQFHGVENLPYLYRLRMAILKASLPVPFGASPHTYRTDAYDNTPALTQQASVRFCSSPRYGTLMTGIHRMPVNLPVSLPRRT